MALAQAFAGGSPVATESAHIVLEAPRENERSSRHPVTVTGCFELKNLVRGTVVRLKLYEEGFLSVCADRRRGHGDEQLLDLRYLDPRPRISRVVAVRLLYPAIYSAALAVAATAFASFGVLPAVTWPLASAFGAAAATLAWLFGSRTGEHATFRTARGQTEALDLFGPLGSVDMLRRIVPALVVAIREAAEAAEPTDAHTYLREEMREHYRLAQAGVISPAECATGTYRILAQFARAHDGPRA